MQFIKVPHQLIANANKVRCVREVLFYYQFKAIAPNHGVLDSKCALTALSKHLKITHNGVRRLLDNNRFIEKRGRCYAAISYARVWSALSIKTRNIRDRKTKRRIDKVECKLFKIHVDYTANHQHLQAAICAEELKLNKIQQLHNVRRRKVKTANVDQLRFKQMIDPTKYIVQQEAAVYHHDVTAQQDDSFINYDITLSCAGTAALLGYSSTSKGHHLQRTMQELGLATVCSRTVNLRIGSQIDSAKVFRTSNGQLKARLCNAITIL